MQNRSPTGHSKALRRNFRLREVLHQQYSQIDQRVKHDGHDQVSRVKEKQPEQKADNADAEHAEDALRVMKDSKDDRGQNECGLQGESPGQRVEITNEKAAVEYLLANAGSHAGKREPKPFA